MGRILFAKLWPLLKVLVSLFKLLPRFFHTFIWSLTTAFSGPLAVLIRYLSFSALPQIHYLMIYLMLNVLLCARE